MKLTDARTLVTDGKLYQETSRKPSSGLLFDKGKWWEQYWGGMPEYESTDLKPYHSINVNLRNEDDFVKFQELIGANVHHPGDGGGWTWYPPKAYVNWKGVKWVNDPPVLPRYPVFVPTKGRWESLVTIRYLRKMGVPHRVVVEPQEAEKYIGAGVPEADMLILPDSNRGLVFVRNWIWDLARDEGHKRFWTLDDNVFGFYRFHQNQKIQVSSGACFRAMEDWVDRYQNVVLAGMQYDFFICRRRHYNPLSINCRVYSNMLIYTDYRDPRGNPYRNDPALRFNDDTDLNLRIMKDGNCTVLFNAFLMKKSGTMMVKGGMDYQRSENKEEDDRYKASCQLRDKHPDVTTIVERWGRWHHYVDYSRFRDNQLIPVPGAVFPEGRYEYGMELKTVTDEELYPDAPDDEEDDGDDPEPDKTPEPVKPKKEPKAKAAKPVRASIAPVELPDRVVGSTASGKQSLLIVSEPEPEGWQPDPFPSLEGATEVAVDFETTGLRWWEDDRPCGAAISWKRGGVEHSCYLPFGHKGSTNLDEERVKEWMRSELRGKKVLNLNTKFDLHMAIAWGVDLRQIASGFGDVGHYAALLDDHRQRFNLNGLATDYLNDRKEDLDMSSGAHVYPAWRVGKYARKDAALVIRLWDKMAPLLKAQDLERVAALEDALIPVTTEMEHNGCPMDVERLIQWEKESETELAMITDLLQKQIGWPINVNATADVARLCEERGHRSKVKTDTGAPSYPDSVLAEFEKGDHIIAQLREVIHVSDLRSKFLTPYVRAVGRDDIMRYQLHQLRSDFGGTVSGRYSSSSMGRGDRMGINVQQVYSTENQKKRTGDRWLIRELFVPPTDRLLLGGDSEQIEFRLFAHYAGARSILEAYDKDPHTDFHQAVTGIAHRFREDLTRKQMKNCNFAIIFGAGMAKTAAMMGVSKRDAEEFLGIYNAAFPEAKHLLKRASRLAESRGYVFTLMGRRCRFPNGERSHKALNAIIQGSAADYHKLKLIALYNERERLGITMRMTVHDEIVGDVPDAQAAKEVTTFLDAPAPGMELKVPLLWSVGTGKNWGECK